MLVGSAVLSGIDRQHPLRRHHGAPGLRARRPRPRPATRSSSRCGGRSRSVPTSAATPPPSAPAPTWSSSASPSATDTRSRFWTFTRYGLVVTAVTISALRPLRRCCGTSFSPDMPQASPARSGCSSVHPGSAAALRRAMSVAAGGLSEDLLEMPHHEEARRPSRPHDAVILPAASAADSERDSATKRLGGRRADYRELVPQLLRHVDLLTRGARTLPTWELAVLCGHPASVSGAR